MKFKAIVEYEYPVEHKLPAKAEIVLHGDRVITDNIKWVEQESILDEIVAEIEHECKVLGAFSADETLEVGEYLGLKMSLEIIDKYRGTKQ